MSIRAISAKYGVHRGTIPVLARRAGMSARQRGVTDAKRARAASLYMDGMTLTQVARRMEIGDESVRRAVLAEGGQMRPKGRRPRVR